MNYASGTAQFARSVARRVGLTAPLARLRRMLKPGYEHAFSQQLLGAIRPGDTVWDVGANIGLYTAEFAKLVGPGGRVIAFEPAPATIVALRKAATPFPHVRVCDVALSREPGFADFFASARGPDEVGGLIAARSDQTSTKVAVRIGDQYLAEYPPNVIKIDVEGFEKDVLDGMSSTLRSRALRAVFIEVHFDALRKMGRKGGPQDITATLTGAGFAVKWPDSSHIAATR